MKYVNPGMPQLFDYQTLNRLVAGKENHMEHSKTGYYLNLSTNDNDVFYKVVEPTSNFCLLFDLAIVRDATISGQAFVNKWIKLVDFYNDQQPELFLQLAYRQKNKEQFEINVLNNIDYPIGTSMLIDINEINTFELRVSRDIVTNIGMLMNGKQEQIIKDTVVGEGVWNRFNFYCSYVYKTDVSLSHIIYNTVPIGYERIKMLKTDKESILNISGTSNQFMITESLNNRQYTNITGFGVISATENMETTTNNINVSFDSTQILSYEIDPEEIKHEATYMSINPKTNEEFHTQEIENKIITVEIQNA